MGLTKDCLKAVMPKAGMSTEEFQTVLCGVACCLNNRPIAGDPGRELIDGEVLTPAHFLMGSTFSDIAAAPEQKEFGIQRSWFHVQAVLDRFWNRACKEMVPHMQPLNKWMRPKAELAVGDIVLVIDGQDRARWPLGRIINTAKSSDGIVRTVKIRMGDKRELTRAAQSVLLLVAATA